MGASSGPPPPRCAGLGCSSAQEGPWSSGSALPGPAIRHSMPGRPLSTGDKRRPWLPDTLLQLCPAQGGCGTGQAALAQPSSTGQRLHQCEHKNKLRHFPGLRSSHSLDTGHRSDRAGNMELSSVLLRWNEP